jgi:hypothetical protein
MVSASGGFEPDHDLGERRFAAEWHEPLWWLADAHKQPLLREACAQLVLDLLGDVGIVDVDIDCRRVLGADARIDRVGIGGVPRSWTVDVDRRR